MTTTTYFVDDLQCCEPDGLSYAEGIRVTFSQELDFMGFHRATVEGPSAEAVIEYVRANWGDDDREWFDKQVVGELRSFVAPSAESDALRTILIHLNVEAQADDTRSAEEIATLIEGALASIGIDSTGLDITLALAEEV